MKIVEVNTYTVRPRWGFVEIVTDEGLTGWGEPVLEGHCATVLACVQEMKPYLIGKDPMRIEDFSAVLYRAGFYRGGGVLMSAIAGIDQALWDIKGKFFNAPVYQLMGGACRDNMRVYSWIGGDRPSDVGAAALERKNAGFTAIKMNATEELQMIDTYDKVDAVLERVAAIRESCGKYFGIAIDFHGRVHKPMAKVLAKKLEEFDPMFIEEPVLCENMEVFKEIAAACNVPIATGERLFTKYDFKRLLQAGGVDIIQPDLTPRRRPEPRSRRSPPWPKPTTLPGSPLPAGPHRSGQLPERGRHLLQRRDPGAEHRHPLQRGQERAGLCQEPGRLQVRGRPRAAARPSRFGRGRQQGTGAGGEQDPARVEEPRLASQGRQRCRVVMHPAA